MRNIMIGVVIGAALFLGGSVFANEVESWIGKTIEGQFPVSIDGERIEQPGIVVEGTSYLPVRAAGELFGYEVSFLDSEVLLSKEESSSREGGEEVGLLKSYEDLSDEDLLKEHERWTNTLDALPENKGNDAREITNTQIMEIERIMDERGIELVDDELSDFHSMTDEQLKRSIKHAQERIETNEKIIKELQKRGDRQHNIDSIRAKINEYETEITEKEAELERRTK